MLDGPVLYDGAAVRDGLDRTTLNLDRNHPDRDHLVNRVVPACRGAVDSRI